MLSLAVDFDLTCIQERHQLRDAVLGDDLVVSLNDALEKRGFTEQLAVDNTVFFQQYAASLLTFSQLTDHQTEKLKELSRYLHEDVHLSAPAGGGKTFLAVRHAMNKLRSSSKGKILFISPNRPLCFHFVHWLLMHARSSLPKVSRNKLLQRLVFMHAPYDSFTRAQIAADSYIVLEELKAMPDDLVLAIFDEAHAIFRTNQGIFQEVHAQRKLVLSDRSQSFLLETKYPEMRRVHLTEVVRSTKRLVLGANAFQLQDEPITCLGTTGPPLKSFIFESPKGVDHDFFTQFADHTVKALWFIMCTHPSIRLDRHVALLVPDEEFYRRFRFHLEDRLEAAFAPSYNIHLISFEDSLRFLPETAHQDRKRDELILDWDSNATGLEILFVVCIGFDVEIAGELDNFTRARLYHAITRAQLQAIVVDRLVQGGWLAYLTTLKLREMTFRLGDAESEINEDAALRIVMEAAQSEADSNQEADTKATSPLSLRGSWVWDTSANISKADADKLRFDPMAHRDGIRARPQASLIEYFLKDYKSGGGFQHDAYKHDADGWCWIHKKSGIKVWQDALDLTQSGGTGEVKCLFHYTSQLGFRSITAPSVLASLHTEGEKTNAWWGRGVYCVAKAPHQWPDVAAIIDNNYRNVYKRDVELKGSEFADQEYASRVAYCMPILANAMMCYDVSVRQTPEMLEKGMPPGVNLAGKQLNEPGQPERQCVVIRVEREDGVGNARAILLDTLRCRADAAAERLGPEHDEALLALSRLAHVLMHRGAFAEAEPLRRRVLDARERRWGPEHRLGKLSEAEALFRRCLRAREVRLGAHHPETLTSVSNLAVLLRQQGKMEEADKLQCKALALEEAQLGANHPHTLQSINHLAALLQTQGKLHEAEKQLRRALAGGERELGPQHPETLAYANSLALLLQKLGKMEEAEDLLRRALDGREGQLGMHHPTTLGSVYNLAALLEAKGSFGEAGQLYLRELHGMEERYGPEHEETLRSRHNCERFEQEHGIPIIR
ncbi:unnamed protein product [Cladocopium goreaui]|uniref:Helicase ATP-binding domain-containing protein n=1 Tax=Cladocopium goreaui TaxID=2562237 RepID=A0A9P1FT06_9DINO|nr:unnamed protein product [Cladocopium goreaui]